MTDPTLRDLLGDPDEANGILDRFEIHASPLKDRSLVVTMCRRDHGDEGPTVMAIMRDTEGSQKGLTLAELVDAALAHENEEHPVEGP